MGIRACRKVEAAAPALILQSPVIILCCRHLRMACRGMTQCGTLVLKVLSHGSPSRCRSLKCSDNLIRNIRYYEELLLLGSVLRPRIPPEQSGHGEIDVDQNYRNCNKKDVCYVAYKNNFQKKTNLLCRSMVQGMESAQQENRTCCRGRLNLSNLPRGTSLLKLPWPWKYLRTLP